MLSHALLMLSSPVITLSIRASAQQSTKGPCPSGDHRPGPLLGYCILFQACQAAWLLEHSYDDCARCTELHCSEVVVTEIMTSMLLTNGWCCEPCISDSVMALKAKTDLDFKHGANTWGGYALVVWFSATVDSLAFFNEIETECTLHCMKSLI